MWSGLGFPLAICYAGFFARELLTADLHNMVHISSSAPFGELPLLGGDSSSVKQKKTAENVALASCSGLSASTFRLPACHIR